MDFVRRRTEVASVITPAPSQPCKPACVEDLSEGKNPCGYDVVPNNRRVEMRFPEFRKKLRNSQQGSRESLTLHFWSLEAGK